MVNVGLRAYIWQQKSAEEQTARELWTLNAVTYEGYRQYVSYCKEHGFSQVQALHVATRPSSAGSSKPQLSQVSTSSAGSTTSQAHKPFLFAGMQHVATDDSGVTVLKFGKQSSALLAYGCQDGSVHVLNLEEAGDADHVLREHKQAVADLDWSLDDTLLLCVALDGNISMWLTASGQLLRTFRATSAALCARFHMVNQNLMLVGTKAGAVQVFNGSTGKMVLKQMVCDNRAFPAGTSCCAMALSSYYLFVADSKGSLYILRCGIKNGMLLSLVVLSRTLPPGGAPVQIASLVYSPFSSLAHGPALLTSALDGQLCLHKLVDMSVGQLELVSRVALPKAARKISATFCPETDPGGAECVVTGGEDTNVYIYDISRPSSKPIVINQLQGHVAPAVDISWSQDETMLASCDCDGTVIVWKRGQFETCT